MADDSLPGNGAEKSGLARRLANLKPIAKGEVRNPTGTNGFRRRQELIASILDEKDDDNPLEPGCSRIRSVILATVREAKGGDSGAQKTCIEHYAGKARAQLDVSNEDGSLLPAVLRVLSEPSAEAQPAQDEPKGDVG